MAYRFRLRLALLASVVVSGCSPDNRLSEEQIEFLASDAHVAVGGASLVLPFAALPGYVAGAPSFSLDRKADRERARRDLAAFRAAARRRDSAPTLDRIQVDVGPYGMDDFGRDLMRICPRLRRHWARSVCDDAGAPLERAMPKNPFLLVDVRAYPDFALHGVLGGQPEDHRFPEAPRAAGQVSTVCDAPVAGRHQFCKASVLITGDLGAVWTVWDGDDSGEDHRQRAEREAAAIRAFVLHGLGPSEDYARLLAASCRFREPVTSDNRDDACRQAAPAGR